MPIVFGTLRTAAGESDSESKILFRVEGSRAERFGNDVRSSRDVEISPDASGFFSQYLDPGSYLVWVGGSSRSLVYVKADTEYVLFADLFGPSPAGGSDTDRGQNWRLSNAERQLLNGDTGVYHSPFVAVVASQKELAFQAAGDGGEVANFRYRDGMLELYCQEEDTWHAPYLYGGAFYLSESATDPVENDRIVSGVWQIKDLATNRFRTWFVTGAAGSETIGFGPEFP